MTNKDRRLKEIKEEVLALKSSPLYLYRLENDYFPVIGEGNHDAKIMFVGEAPGKNEAKTGKPFCGSAGKVLDNLLLKVGIDRKNVYVTNIIKDRPPFNRDPLPNEIVVYGTFLDRQIDIIQPEVIVTLGRFSMKYIMEKFGLNDVLTTIGQLHGKIFRAKTGYGEITILPLYHPSATIYDRKKLQILEEDFKVLSKFK